MRAVLRSRRWIPATFLLALGLTVGTLVSAPPSSAAPSGAATAGATITGYSCGDATASAKSCFVELGRRHQGLTSMSLTTGPHFSDPTQSSFNGYLPSDLKAAYNIPTSSTTATIAVVDAYDAPNLESDLATYRATLGLPACTTANGCFSKLNQNGAASPLPPVDPHATAKDPGWAGETTLDVEAISAVCPTCHIMVIESNDNDSAGTLNMEAAVSEAVALGAKYVSMSWGSSEKSSELARDSSTFGTKGVAYVASAGDYGYGVEYPAASPNVTSVGGTALIPDSSTARGWQEFTWNELSNGHGATGSGCSAYEAKPSYQAGISATVCAGRAVADVSMVADPYSGLSVYEAPYGWFPVGGTSLAAPMIAGLYAIAGTPAANTTPAAYPYATATAFNDITLYGNGTCSQAALCTAGAGWDGPTGLGTPNGVNGFAATGVATPPPTTPNPPPPPPVTPTADHLTLGGVPAKSSHSGDRTAVALTATSSTGAAVTLSASGLPTGVRLSGRSLSGVVTRQGTFHVTVSARDASGAHASTTFTWKVRNHTIVATKRLTVSGTLKVGKVVKAVYGSLRFDSAHGATAHASAHFQWFANGKPIKGAHGSSLKVTAGLRGKHLTFTLTATAKYANKYSHGSGRTGSIK